VPALTKVGLLEYREGDAKAHAALALLNDAARALGIEVAHDRVETAEELEPTFGRWTRQGVRGYMIISNVWFNQLDTIQRLSELALKYRIATCIGASQYADAGSLMSYAVDYVALFGQSAKLIDRILKGADPADIPVEQANVFELVLNQRTARAFGIEFPRSLIAQATRVIE
jgi:putative ABC transport system substrate-binding protein